jgi:hypothetical protein
MMEELKQLVFEEYKIHIKTPPHLLLSYAPSDHTDLEPVMGEERYVASSVKNGLSKKITGVWKMSHDLPNICKVHVSVLQEKHNKMFVEKLMGYMILILRIIHKLSKSRKILNDINIVFVDVHIPKLMSMDNVPDPNNVNTGVTIRFPHSMTPRVIVYRREEIVKVLIHELLHAWWFQLAGCERQIKELQSYFNISTLNFNEAYVDSLAMMINCCICCRGDPSQFQMRWRLELDHVLEKATCVVMIYDNLFGRGRDLPIEEKTNTFSYYVVKCMLFMAGDKYWDLFAGFEFAQGHDAEAMTLRILNVIESQCQNTSVFWTHLVQNYKRVGMACKDGASMRMSTNDVMKSI